MAGAAGEGGPRVLVVTGVAGAGKSTVGMAVAIRLGWTFADADDFHSPANVTKMRGGTALTDTDRQGWLADLDGWIGEQEAAGRSAVLACSALRRAHRDRLRRDHPAVRFAHLDVGADVVRQRLERREHHFLPPDLLDDQIAILEPLGDDEPGFTVDAAAEVAAVTERVLGRIGR